MTECADKKQMHSGVPGDDPWTECGRSPADADTPNRCVGEEACPYLRAEALAAAVRGLVATAWLGTHTDLAQRYCRYCAATGCDVAGADIDHDSDCPVALGEAPLAHIQIPEGAREVTQEMALGYLRKFLTQLDDGLPLQLDIFRAANAVEKHGPASVVVEVAT